MTKKYLIASIVSVLVILIGVSVAYFSTRIVGTGKNITVNSKELKIIFTDTDAISAHNVNPGWSISKTFTVENRSDATYNYNIVFKNLVNTFVTTGYLQYKIESTNGGNTCDWTDVPKSATATDTIISQDASIAVGVTQTYTLYFRYQDSENDQNVDQGKIVSGKIAIAKYTPPTLVEKVLELNPTRLTRTSFTSVLTTKNTGTLYTTNNTEDGSTVYYFAGNALNNWVKFGKCTNSTYNCTEGEDLYWRIIRTNEDIEDGGVRLLYAGSGSVAATNAYIKSAEYHGRRDNSMYVGYMWGTTGSLENNRTNQTNKSNAATQISSWYTATFNTSSDANSKDSSGNLYHNYISKTAIYCNDRAVGEGTYNTSSTTFRYAAYRRLDTYKKPSYACGANTNGYGSYFEETPSIADKFTGSETNSSGTTIGNGLLGNTPAALITADEIAFAGGKYATDAQTWYYYNAASTPGSSTSSTYWFTMSPSEWVSSRAFVYRVSGSGNLGDSEVSISYGLRPAISLSSDVLWAGGDGSSSSPFEVAL